MQIQQERQARGSTRGVTSNEERRLRTRRAIHAPRSMLCEPLPCGQQRMQHVRIISDGHQSVVRHKHHGMRLVGELGREDIVRRLRGTVVLPVTSMDVQDPGSGTLGACWPPQLVLTTRAMVVVQAEALRRTSTSPSCAGADNIHAHDSWGEGPVTTAACVFYKSLVAVCGHCIQVNHPCAHPARPCHGQQWEQGTSKGHAGPRPLFVHRA
mmetsp:Transcript_32676/g.90185  ORF Transcript_32676/g.90185 Transcript_32676/m.90185 type:complete len:211 (+) Transcript_32676:1792-2424(+)